MRNVLHLSAQLNTAEVGEEGLLPFLATDGQRGWTFVLSKENVLFAVDTATNEVPQHPNSSLTHTTTLPLSSLKLSLSRSLALSLSPSC